MTKEAYNITLTSKEENQNFGISRNGMSNDTVDVSLQVASASLHEVVAEPSSILFFR
jgi:hypothetical protein